MEQSLDPTNWEEMRRLGHEMVDTMMDYLREVGQRPAWQRVPEEVVEAMRQPLPVEGQSFRSVYEEFLTRVLPYNVNNVHPRFWAWVQGGGTPAGMLADMLASGMNANLAIGDQAPVYVERQVLDWAKEMFGFPAEASGILTSGGSMANITALIVARNHFSPAAKQKGLRAEAGALRVYGSEETHNCMVKGVEAVGIGSDNFRKVPVDDDYRVRVDVLAEMIAADRAAGYLPFCIVGNAGTVNTGAVDDLEGLAEIARREGCWFHVDGAFGAVPYILPEWKATLQGLRRADSLSFDYHKWLYVNYEVGCVLIRDEKTHLAAFSAPAAYLLKHDRGLAGGPAPFSGYGLELSRGFKALKVWMLLKEHGVEKYGRMVRQNLEQAQFLGSLVLATAGLELLAGVSMNIVCYRYNPGGLGDAELNLLNKEILMRLQEEGIASPSYTLLRGRYAIRVAITNHRSTRGDFEVLVRETVRLGK
ncbi:MAG TPA: pyridoxal-dependent decarboxylase, partial [Puia sp.]|nr:pyridoxal-dependent decarboxylase [Puia sp.]